jgi:AcrR family transcriptional regulator
MRPTSPRVQRRRAADRERILRVAARRFAAAGPENVRLDEVAQEADVARGTLYSHFPSKQELLQEVLRPALERAHAGTRGLTRLPFDSAVNRLLDLYLELWREYPDSLRVAYRMPEGALGPLADLHRKFLNMVLRTFGPAARTGLLRAGDPALSARVLARVAVPLLELLSQRPGGEALFVQSIRGLLLGRGPVRPLPRASGERRSSGTNS